MAMAGEFDVADTSAAALSWRGRGVVLLAGIVTLAAATADIAAPPEPPPEIPYRRGALVIDGRADDWRGPALEVQLDEPELGEPARNRARVRVTWDRGSLYALFEVHDAEVFAPPANAPALTLYQWDAVEIYLDARGSGGARMDADDYQVLIACDGQVAVLQGDPVLAQAPGLRVPKSVRHGIAVVAAAVIVPGGYTVECAIPFAAVGVPGPHAGEALGLDLAVDDWTRDHRTLPFVPMDLDNVVGLATGRDQALRVEDPAAVGAAAKKRLIHDASFPWAWSGTRDFGYPNKWHRVTLLGGPPPLERLTTAIGANGVAAASAAATAILCAAALAGVRRRQRKRLATLLQKLAELERAVAQAPPAEAVAPAIPASEPPALPAAQLLLGRGGHPVVVAVAAARRVHAATPALAARAMQYIEAHLGENLNSGRLADALYVSRRTLERAIATALSCTPHELLLGVRMQVAERLLGEGMRVADVAERVGFVSAPHFSRTFKRYFGVSPSARADHARRLPGIPREGVQRGVAADVPGGRPPGPS